MYKHFISTALAVGLTGFTASQAMADVGDTLDFDFDLTNSVEYSLGNVIFNLESAEFSAVADGQNGSPGTVVCGLSGCDVDSGSTFNVTLSGSIATQQGSAFGDLVFGFESTGNGSFTGTNSDFGLTATALIDDLVYNTGNDSADPFSIQLTLASSNASVGYEYSFGALPSGARGDILSVTDLSSIGERFLDNNCTSNCGTYDINSGTVPEPLTILGAGTAIAFGAGFKRKLAKTKKK